MRYTNDRWYYSCPVTVQENWVAMDTGNSPLLTDLYQFNMLQSYLDHGMTNTAVFEFFSRKLPARRGFLMAAGLAQAVDFLANVRFGEAELEWIRKTGRFRTDFIDYLSRFEFTGDVDAMAEGTVFFADEPILRITAPLPQAQLVESRLINIVHFQSLIASKAALRRGRTHGRRRPNGGRRHSGW